MATVTLFLTFLAVQTVSLARPQAHFENSVDYYDPRLAGGSMLNNGAFYVLQRVPQYPLTLSTAGGGLGEPLNVITPYRRYARSQLALWPRSSYPDKALPKF